MPQTTNEKLVAYIDKLLVETTKGLNLGEFPNPGTAQQYERVVALVQHLSYMLGDKGAHWKEQLSPSPSHYESAQRQFNTTIQVIKEVVQDDLLHQIEEFVRAEVFDNLLEQADYLHESGYLTAAGALGRAVLEQQVRSLCDREGLTPTKARPTINDYNQALYGGDIYDKLEMKRVDLMATIGNDAAHAKAVTLDDVKGLLKDVREFLTRQPL
jgi:hypothetical protein